MIVIDPRRSETAAMADFHLAVRPGTDAWCLAAMAAILVAGRPAGRAAGSPSTRPGYDTVEPALNGQVPIAEYARSCGVDEALLRRVAERIARAKSVSMIEDLGVQMNRYSTLVSWLQRLVWLLAGHFARPGHEQCVRAVAGARRFLEGRRRRARKAQAPRRARGSAARSRSAQSSWASCRAT